MYPVLRRQHVNINIKGKNLTKDINDLSKKVNYIYNIVEDDIDIIDACFNSIDYLLDNTGINIIGIFRNLNYYLKLYKEKKIELSKLMDYINKIKNTENNINNDTINRLLEIKNHLEEIIKNNKIFNVEYKSNNKVCYCSECYAPIKDEYDYDNFSNNSNDNDFMDINEDSNSENFDNLTDHSTDCENCENCEKCNYCNKDDYEYIEDNCSLDSFSPENETYIDKYNYENIDNIKRVLLKLNENNKVLHYDSLFEKMKKSTDDEYEEYENEIIITSSFNKKEIKYKILKLQTFNKPTKWFYYYGKNIGCFS